MQRKHHKILLTTLLILATGWTACGEEPIGESASRAFVQKWQATVAANLAERSEGAPIRKELQKRLEAAQKREEAASQRDLPPLMSLANTYYAANEYKPIFVQHGKLSPQGKAVWETMQDLEASVLDPRPYRLAEIQKALDALESKGAELQTNDLNPGAEATAEMSAWVAAQKPSTFTLDESSYEVVTERLLESDTGAGLRDAMGELGKLGQSMAASSAELEELMAHAFMRYAYEVRYFRARKSFVHPREDDYFNDPEIRKSRNIEQTAHYVAGSLWRRAAANADAMYSQPVYARRELSNAIARVAKSEKPAEVLAALMPQQPQYAGLVEEHKRYQEIVAAGGWEKVEVDKKLKAGSKGSSVRKLKERLAMEGYLKGDPKKFSDTYDASLTDAVKDYQTTHQMQVTGSPHTVFWKSLNVPAERRLEQIRINIQRWRDTNMRPEDDKAYVFINVADFHAEGWRDGKREIRHRVVVGNNDNVCDPETDECAKANRTPIPISAYIDRMIFNPFWNVTPRVRKNEILPDVKKSVEAQYAKMRAKAAVKPPSFLAAPPVDTPPLVVPQPLAEQPSGDAPTADVGQAALSPERLAEMPYFNVETGEVDVSTTIPEKVPSWYAENNYEVMYAGKSWEYVRMTPGAHNALGYVKIIFPNLHDVYLHDTNARALFKNDLRAYSHGCMRLEDPIEFATWLLDRDGQKDVVDTEAIKKSGEYLPIFLTRQVPVFVEYYTVRVDDNGRANFLADIYDLDDNPHLPEPPQKPVDL